MRNNYQIKLIYCWFICSLKLIIHKKIKLFLRNKQYDQNTKPLEFNKFVFMITWGDVFWFTFNTNKLSYQLIKLHLKIFWWAITSILKDFDYKNMPCFKINNIILHFTCLICLICIWKWIIFSYLKVFRCLLRFSEKELFSYSNLLYILKDFLTWSPK